MDTKFKELIDQLCADELDYLLDCILSKKEENEESNNEINKIICRERNLLCPDCGSTHILKNGKRKMGTQKLICAKCKKSFSPTTNTVMHYSKKSYAKWKHFIECELNHMTLDDTAFEVGISKTTAFNWRHKLFESIKSYIEGNRLSGTIQMDALYKRINLKGTKPHKMPRISKKRSSRSKLKGISHHKVCIVSAIDENDQLLFKVAGLGKETISYYHQITPNFNRVNQLIGDNFWGFTTLGEELNCDVDLIPSGFTVSNNGNDINNLNGLHSELNTWLRKYRGVSIRHLQGYLNMFIFIKQLKYEIERKAMKYVAFIRSLINNAKLKNKEICNLTLPIDLKVAYGEYHYGIFANQSFN